ncbi:type I methionyl aminopeptidase [Candidatus Daviesbacteria bacterium]|nr:type I methionyl aminopeptidase [Candidatus Daviesbacteria bacterium]
MNVLVRTKKELELMRKSGQISASALKKTLDAVKPGISLQDLEKIAEDEILRLGGGVSFKTVPGYRWATCLTINDEVVHGIPRDIELKIGDILSIDLGAVYQSWHTDTAWSIVVGKEQNQFLKVGEQALWNGIDQAIEGKRIGDISEAIQNVVESNGYSIVRSLIGHGVGRELHEEPEVPGFGKKGTGLVLKKGMTIAIEVIYTSGSGEVKLSPDGWTIESVDHSMGGLFEMTVVIGEKKAEILTDFRGIK